MEMPVAVIPAPAPGQQGSRMRQFLAQRGVIIMKENRTVASIPTVYGNPLDVGGQVLVTVQHTERHVSVGVKFEQAESNTHISSEAFVDSDELDEFVGALNFILVSAQRVANDARDYTEVTYSTRDDVTIGFFQEGLRQQAFARLGVGSPLIFIGIELLRNLCDAVVQAREHVDQRRTAWETR